MVNKQYKNRFFVARIIFEKKNLLCFFVLVAKQPILNILKNRALSHQIIMFIHVVCVLIGPVIYSHQNLFVNNDCGFLIFFLYLIVSIKRIEKTKNRVKSDLEITIKAIDSKHVKFFSAIESADSKRKKMEFAVQHIGLKNRKFQQAVVKQKRLREIWFFLSSGK